MMKVYQKVFSSLLILALALALIPVYFAGAAPSLFTNPTTTVFINEIHYDNAGTDAGESVEIAGPAGTDLTGWSVVLYNGSNGTVYDTDALSGTITDQGGGYGFYVVNYPTNGIQNGSPDGIALVNGSTLVQFLSYEGTFVGVGGPADGITSTDIGVVEGSGTAIGDSLQLVGSGTTYGDFSWSTEAASTFGALNNGQTFGGAPTAKALVINEIDYDQPSTDTAEFVEIRNNDSVSVDLSAYSLQFVNGNGGAVYDTINLPAVSLAAGDYFVVCANAATVANCDLDDAPDTNFIQNGAPDAVALFFGSTLVDTVSYEGDTVAPYTEGSGDGLVDSAASATDGISRCPDGSDTDQNNFDFSLREITPGAANVCGSATLEPVINEFSASTTGTDVEYVEIFGSPNTDYSAYAVLELEGDSSSNMGTVDEVISLGTTDANGFYLASLPANALENGSISLLLVKNFTGALGNDLDTTDDGAFNSTPWDEVVDAVSVSDGGSDDLTYGVPALGPNYDGVSSFAPGGASRIPDGFDTDASTDWVRNDFDLAGIPGYTGSLGLGEALNTPGATNEIYVAPPEACGDAYTPIYTIQGSGSASDLDGSEVATEGIVVGDFQEGKFGFYIQDAVGDGDITTSDGIFVYSTSTDVSVGDHVRVRGVVDEFFGLTEITGVSLILSCGTGNVTPTALSLPVYDLEHYEGMLVTFEQSLYISEYYNFGRYGEIVLTTDRQFQPTATYEPGSGDASDLLAYNLSHRIKLDDGNGSQNPDPALHPNGNIFDLSNLFRGGDILNNVTGVVDYNFGEYKLQPVSANHVEANPRTAQPDDVGGNLKVASFNVLNYFTTIDTGDWICGPSGDMECRGADTVEEFERQRAKIIAALAAIDADVVGLIEIENNEYEAVADLVAGLNDTVGAGTYGYIDTGYIGEDAIKVAFIYKTATVSLVGNYAILDESVDSRFIDSKNRPALAQTFMDNSTGGVFTAVVNHLKSKGSPCDDIGDPDIGDGAGNCNQTRTDAAYALVDWLATDPTGSGDADFLIMGDLNAYDKEDPIDALIAGGYSDMVYYYLGENAYSYVFDGQLGYLDHALANNDLAEEISGVTIWHINADEASLIDYDMTYKKDAQDAIYAPDAYRSSDHDPVIIGLNVCDEIAPTFDELSVSPDNLWPANHKYVDVTTTVVVSDNFDPNPTVELISVISSEADNGLGDGDTADDIVIVDDFTFRLRAERSGVNGEGRTYTITYRVTDACGNFTEQSVTVFVPFSQKKK